VLNGSKQFISGAGVSDVYVVMARTGEDGPKGISAFIIPKGTQGLSFGANEKKMGWNAQPTRQVLFDTVRIPCENRLGDEGQGFAFAMKGLDGGRLNIAACSLGGAQDALDRARGYAGQRKQFGKTLDAFQATQFKLADMETELQAARSLLYDAAQKLDAKAPDATKWCAMAKRFVTDTGSKVANDALQIHGGYGYLHDYGVERIVRDLRVHQILEGTNEIMRVIIARHMETA
jgi:alkylation response protein AidB-like acyl-CoA dehydrogenase